MFGLGFGEMVMLAIVLLVVVGPRELPKLLRTLGQGITKLRRMTGDLREQSGIDEILQEEGLREDIEAIRSLSRGNVVESFVNSAAKPKQKPSQRRAPSIDLLRVPAGDPPPPDEEYPEIGCDAYGALPDDALPYVEDTNEAPEAPGEETAAKAPEDAGDAPEDADKAPEQPETRPDPAPRPEGEAVQLDAAAKDGT